MQTKSVYGKIYLNKTITHRVFSHCIILSFKFVLASASTRLPCSHTGPEFFSLIVTLIMLCAPWTILHHHIGSNAIRYLHGCMVLHLTLDSYYGKALRLLNFEHSLIFIPIFYLHLFVARYTRLHGCLIPPRTIKKRPLFIELVPSSMVRVKVWGLKRRTTAPATHSLPTMLVNHF